MEKTIDGHLFTFKTIITWLEYKFTVVIFVYQVYSFSTAQPEFHDFGQSVFSARQYYFLSSF